MKLSRHFATNTILSTILLWAITSSAGNVLQPTRPRIHNVLQDPCINKNLENLPNVVIEPVDPSIDFQREFGVDPVAALKKWLLTTQTFTRRNHSINRIELLPLNPGCSASNQGIYEVYSSTSPSDPHYILKVSIENGEVEHLWKLQNSIAAHPRCLTSNPELLGTFPVMPKIHEAATFHLAHS